MAVDTEFLRERTYFPKLCLIQLGTHDEQVAIDPLAKIDLSGVGELLADPAIPKVFHACSQDVEILTQTFGTPPENVFDTQIAAAFLGHRLQLGYGTLVESYCGVHLDKAASLTDWSRRPLDAEQLAYALDDVRYLPKIYDRMMKRLKAKKRLEWVLPECEAARLHAIAAADPKEAYLHVRRAGGLTRRQLGVLREVALARDTMARRRNIPRKWVLGDEVLVEVAKRMPTTMERLRKIRGTAQLSEGDANLMLIACRRGKECPTADLPEVVHHSKPSQEAESAVDLLYAMLRVVAEESRIAAPLIANREDLLDFIAGRPNPLQDGWRAEVAGEPLRRLMAGEIGLTIKCGKVVRL